MKRTPLKRGPAPARKTPLNARPKRGQSPKALKNKATELHSRYVRLRDGRCQRCGTTNGQLQCSHIISRSYAATRTKEYGACCLCAACHRRLTAHPDEHYLFHAEWLLRAFSRSYADLKAEAEAGKGLVMKAPYWHAEIDRLTAAIADLETMKASL